MKKTAIIMAGGAGERFWPFSRKLKPKQLLPLTSNKSMLHESIDKISSIVAVDDCYIVTNYLLKDAILKDIPHFPERNILCEPIGKNTAPCLAFASAVLKKKYDDCLVAVVTADHLIKDDEVFVNNINLALDAAEKDKVIVTIGIPPNRPETGYGYIQISDWLGKTKDGWLGKVKCFHEKPDLETAKHYLASGDYFWNSGMFFYRNSTMLDAFKNFMPELYSGILKINQGWDTNEEQQVIKECFANFQSVSIDVGVMEKFPEIKMVKADFYWDDIGSWTSLERIGKTDENGNVFLGNVVAVESKNTIAYAGSKNDGTKQPLIGLIGISDCVVVISDGCVLVCPKDRVQDVKKIVNKLKDTNKNEYI